MPIASKFPEFEGKFVIWRGSVRYISFPFPQMWKDENTNIDGGVFHPNNSFSSCLGSSNCKESIEGRLYSPTFINVHDINQVGNSCVAVVDTKRSFHSGTPRPDSNVLTEFKCQILLKFFQRQWISPRARTYLFTARFWRKIIMFFLEKKISIALCQTKNVML